MTRAEKLLVVIIVLMMVLSISGNKEATAQPQKATTIKYLSVPSAAFTPLSLDKTFSSFPNYIVTTEATGADFITWVKLPNGARVRKITLYVTDYNATFSACASIHHNVPAKNTTTELGEVCSTGASLTPGKYTVKFSKVKVPGAQNLALLLDIGGINIWVNSVRVGYFK